MVYKGHFKNGVVVLEGNPRLPEGAEVDVQLTTVPQEPTPIAKVLLAFAGKARGFPPDAAEQHDHYIYGTPKR